MTDRQLIERFLRRLHQTGALSVPPEDLRVAVDEALLERRRQDVAFVARIKASVAGNAEALERLSG